MSLESMIISDHLNKIQAGRQVNLKFPTVINGFSPTKLALALICMGYGLKKTCELCLNEVD